MTSSAPVYVGIDTSKRELEVAFGQSRVATFENSKAGIQRLIARLPEAVALIVIESTGCYSQLAAGMLTAAGHRVALVQPGRIKHYARSQGVLAKTDRIDARIIARYGEASSDLTIYQELSDRRKRLRALFDRRDQVIEDRVRESNRLEACTDDLVRKHLKASVAKLQKAEASLERQLTALIRADEELAELADLIVKQKGVALISAACFLAHLPELGHVNRQEIAALVGIAPYNNDSGPHQGKRTIHGGRARVRIALHMAALTAARCDSAMSAFYQSLVARGKLAKVALVAVARKMLIRINSLVAQHLRAKASPNLIAP